jgi:hypothetical protein
MWMFKRIFGKKEDDCGHLTAVKESLSEMLISIFKHTP